MEFGKRLLPQVVDRYAQTDANRVFASFSRSPTGLSDGFRDVTMAKMASMVNRLSWWLDSVLGVGSLNTIAYIGPSDIRYAAVFLAAVKSRYKMLFISPRNHVSQNQRMLAKSDCRALFYGEELLAAVEPLKNSVPHLVVECVASLNELLETPDDTKHYPYEKSFDEAQNEPCLILHSSGSTGDPKLVTMTHGTFSITDNDRNMPVPEGRIPQNGTQFNFEGGGKFYSCFPPYHLAGVHAYITQPIFSTSATVVLGPKNLPPSGFLLSEILKFQNVRAFYVPPFIIEQWSAEPISSQQAKQLDFVLFGGGPLSPHIGDRLSQVTNVCQMYGSLEIGKVQLLVPRPGEWSYMELNPFEEADMQSTGDGSFEMVLHQHPKFATHRCLWHNFPDVKSWHTGDLFVPHPSKPGLWRFQSRIDDLVVLSSSHKIRPVEMESIIQGDPLLSGVLIVGQGKPEPLLIVEPKPGAYDGNSGPFIDRIWPTVEESNKIAPNYARIMRSHVLVAQPDKPFVRAPKGSVIRKQTIQSYADDIEAAYTDKSSHGQPDNFTIPGVDDSILPGLKQLVREHVAQNLSGVQLSDTDNLFLRGLDSLGSIGLSKTLQKALATKGRSSSGHIMSSRMIYKYPTIGQLTFVILSIMFDRNLPVSSIESDTENMENALEEFTKELAPASAGKASLPRLGAINVVLIGPRGSLGPNIVRELLADPRIDKVYCLNRGQDGKEKMRAIFEDRNLPCDVEQERLLFVPIELGKPRLGLSDTFHAELLNNAHLIIHNACKVNFSWSLDSYKLEHLHSVRELVDFSNLSPLQPRIVFVSSISSVQEWAAFFPTPVTEKPLESYDVASSLGYGQSKHVSERILAKASEVSGTPVTILRVGQVAGPSTGSGGEWSTDEWIPSLAAISRELKLIPINLPAIDWVPVDLAARAVCELAVAQEYPEDTRQGTGPPKVFNIVNPNLSEWAIFVETLQKQVGKRAEKVVLSDWVDRLVRADLKGMSETVASTSTKLLPFFQYLAETVARGIALQPRFETSEAVKTSKTMAEMKAIDETQIGFWLQQ